MPKITALNELTTPEAADKLAIVDDSAITTKYLTVANLLKLIYPIGSLYINKTSGTSPATLFGFGTWVRVQGRMIVGVDDADAVFAAGVTGGQKDVQAHNHTAPRGNDNNLGGGTGWQAIDDGYSAYPTSTTGTGVNNMNPYATAYIWQRTV